MLTIVVHYDETPQEWNLIERFFHSGIASGSLAFFRHMNKKTAYHDLLSSVYEYLHLHMVERWQLVWMMNVSEERDFRERLSSQLTRFRERFLSRLQSQKLAPDKVYIIALDGIEREENGAPIDTYLKEVWTLDIHGYLRNKPSASGNLFHIGEIITLDRSWTLPDLSEAGPLEHPTQAYLGLLEMQVEKLKASFSEMLTEKRKVEQQYSRNSDSIPTDVLFEEEIKEVEQRFYARIELITKPPLSPKLVDYKPSDDVKAVLKELMGTKASIADYIFIRVPYPHEYAARRVRALLKVVYAINAIALNDPVSRLWQEGNAYTLDVIFRDRELGLLLNRYLTRLYISKSRIEDSLRNRRLEMAPDYAPWMALPHGQEVLEEIDVPTPQFKYGLNMDFEQQFRVFEDTAREMMERRDQRVLAMAKEGMRKLDIQKKLKEEPMAFIKKEPEEIIRHLQAEADTTRQQLLLEVPHAPASVSKWNDYMKRTKQDMVFLLRSMPAARQIGWLLCAVAGILLAPAVVKWKGPGLAAADNLHPILVYGVYPAIIAVVFMLCHRLSHGRIVAEIKRIVRDTNKLLSELKKEQEHTQKQYTDYLNQLYKLLKLTSRIRDVSKFSSEKGEQNLQLRFHQAKLEEAIDIGKRLAYLLNIQVKEVQDRTMESWYNEQSWFDRDPTAHPVYGPLWDQPGNGEGGAASAELIVGMSRDTIRGALIYPVERLVYEHDRVYRL